MSESGLLPCGVMPDGVGDVPQQLRVTGRAQEHRDLVPALVGGHPDVKGIANLVDDLDRALPRQVVGHHPEAGGPGPLRRRRCHYGERAAGRARRRGRGDGMSRSATAGWGLTSSEAMTSTGSRSCIRAVRVTLVNTCWVAAPRQVMFPPQDLRLTTAGRMARSAA